MNYNTTATKINTSSTNREIIICTSQFSEALAGSVTGARLLERIRFLSSISKQHNKSFYQSIGPTKNPRYGNNQSFSELLNKSPEALRRALKKFAQNLNREPRRDPEKIVHYWIDKNGTTHWVINHAMYQHKKHEYYPEKPQKQAYIPYSIPMLCEYWLRILCLCRLQYKESNVNKNMCVQREEVATEKSHTQSLALIQSDETLIAHFKKQTCSNHEVIQEFNMRLGKRNVDIEELYDLANEIHGRPDKPIGPNIFRKFIRREKPENHELKSTRTSKPKSEVERTQEHAIHDIYARYTQHRRRPEIGILTEHQEREYERILLSVGAIGQPEVLEHMPYRAPMRASDILSNMGGIKRLSNKEVFQKVG